MTFCVGLMLFDSHVSLVCLVLGTCVPVMHETRVCPDIRILASLETVLSVSQQYMPLRLFFSTDFIKGDVLALFPRLVGETLLQF